MSKHLHFRRLPPLNSLKGFESTARLNSASRAAEELHITPPAITHQIQSLEQSLGVDLFLRVGRKLILTDAGKTLYPYALQALSEVRKGLEALSNNINEPTPLRIQTYVTAAIRWLAPRISRFQQHHPDIQIKLDGSASWQFDDEHEDVGIIFLERPPEEEFGWHPLFPYQLIPTCTPELLNRLEGPASAKSIMELPLISVHTEEQYWEMWLGSAGIGFDKLNRPLTVDTLASALEMALNHEGVVLTNGPFAQRELQQGSLVQPFGHKLLLGHWGVIYRRDTPRLQHINAFLDWIAEETLHLKAGC